MHKYTIAITRAGLAIGQTGKMPGASRMSIKTLLCWLYMHLWCSMRQDYRVFFITASSILYRL